jgi:molybdate transport system substrate-binding protein
MRFARIALLCALLTGCAREKQRPELLIAAAADLRFAMDELIARFRAQDAPQETVRVTYGSSGTFEHQIRAGAPYDVYFSADLAYPAKLAADGFARGDVFGYATGQVVAWVPIASSIAIEKGAAALTDTKVRHISVANPEHAPYGKAAVAALRGLGIYDSVKGKLVNGENVSMAWQYASMGSADVGLIALSLALAPNVVKTGRYWEFPASSYPRMDQGGMVVASTDVPELADRFRDYVISPEGKEILQRYGFANPVR